MANVRKDVPYGDGAKCRLLIDSVEKAAVGTNFLRAADAFNAVRHGGGPPST